MCYISCVKHPHILAHTRRDNVGVVVVEGLRTGEKMLGVVTDDDSQFRLTARDAAPIGHKIALVDLRSGDTAVKYGQDIGRIVKAVKAGGHVHTHNLKTKKW